MDRASLMPDVVNFEPQNALFAGEDGLSDYRTLAPQIAQHLNAGGMCILEVGRGQARDVTSLMTNQGLIAEAPELDFSGIARAVIVHKKH